MCRDNFRVEARAVGLFFDQIINTFDPDALMVGIFCVFFPKHHSVTTGSQLLLSVRNVVEI